MAYMIMITFLYYPCFIFPYLDFEEQLPNICAAIADADFISYDYEFTGTCYLDLQLLFE